RLIVTRGVGNLGLNPEQCKTPSVIIITAQIALYPEAVYRNGLSVVTCATRRTNPSALNPAVKSLNYLNNVMARIEANLANADEALLTGTAAEIIPLVKADGRPIGTGKPGPITARMIARFREMTRETGTPIYS